MLAEASAEQRRRLRPYLEDTGALSYAWQRANQHVKEAVGALDCLADSEARSTLRSMAMRVVRRAS
jgi:octaprenyl-diphosphate synthase